jgi:hypothetical protein
MGMGFREYLKCQKKKKVGPSMGQRKGANYRLKWAWVLKNTTNAKIIWVNYGPK